MKILAYVDPGLGLLAWQAIVATFLGALFYIKKSRDFVIKSIQKIFRPSQRPEPAVTVAPAPANDDGR
jgi:hypothetical protein